MDEHAVDSMQHERLELALARAIADGAVVQFASLASLITQLSEYLRLEVRQAFDHYRPFVEGATFYVAHLQVDTACDGRWGVARCCGAHAGYWLIISCGQERYDAAIQRIHDRVLLN